MCYAKAVSLTWSCRLSVTEYAALARKALAQRERCPRSARPMTFDSSYPRIVRTDLSVYSQRDLDRMAHQINAMPRRSLGWESVACHWYDALVAMTT